MTTDFHAERLMVISTARAEGCWTDQDISLMRTQLRDQYYEKVKYGNRPLPQLPSGHDESLSSRDTKKSMKMPDDQEAANFREQLKE